MYQLKKIGLAFVTMIMVSSVLIFGNSWIRDSALRQLSADVRERAQSLVSHADSTLDSALEALVTISQSGTAPCSKEQLLLMRRTVFELDAIKELGVSGGDGSGVCNHIGDDIRLKLASEPLSSINRSVQLQLVEVRGSGKAAMMMSWLVNKSEHYVAIIPTSVLLSGANSQSKTERLEEMSLSDGTRVAIVGDESIDLGSSQAAAYLTHSYNSARYPISATAAELSLEAFSQITTYLAIANVFGVLVLITLVFVIVRVMQTPETPLSAIERGVHKEEFIPYYQPVIDLATGQIMGCEVLTRWQKPDGSIVPPGAFIGLAEASGLAVPMTKSIMRKVEIDLSDLDRHPNWMKIGINLFDAHFENNDIVDDIREIYGNSNIKMAQLMLEVTERQPLSNIERAQSIIKKIQALGAKVALDDAGTGHGGLAYLQQFGMDVVKIDKMFIDEITAETTNSPIVDSMVTMALDLGMDVIAEGIENAHQMEYLRNLGIRAAQGFLFAPPLNAESYLSLCERLASPIVEYKGNEESEVA